MHTFKKIFLLFFVFNLLQCSNHEIQDNTIEPVTKKTKSDFVQIKVPKRHQSVTLNKAIDVEFISSENTAFDSVLCIVNNKTIKLNGSHTNQLKSKLNIPLNNTGRKVLKFVSYLNDSITETDYTEVTVLSDIVPESLTYRILKTYKHQTNAYTQGLVYENGIVYEGTGLTGKSRLMKYLLSDLKIQKEIYLSPELWGEGIAVFDDKIIQLTYKAQKGFIYHKESLDLIREFDYQYYEGWGITYDGEQFIMSDGSNKLYFLDKEYLNENKIIEVYDNVEPIYRLNELEYVDGKIYANVFTKNFIVCVDPETGKVLKKIDLSNLLPPSDRHENTDVLNGIAYIPEKKNFLVTGKNWPKMFEVRFVKK